MYVLKPSDPRAHYQYRILRTLRSPYMPLFSAIFAIALGTLIVFCGYMLTQDSGWLGGATVFACVITAIALPGLLASTDTLSNKLLRRMKTTKKLVVTDNSFTIVYSLMDVILEEIANRADQDNTLGVTISLTHGTKNALLKLYPDILWDIAAELVPAYYEECDRQKNDEIMAKLRTLLFPILHTYWVDAVADKRAARETS